MSESRREFVESALRSGSNMSELCRRFEISRKTAYSGLDDTKQVEYRG